MADGGHTAYIAVNPDGTVQVPANVDVSGIVTSEIADVVRNSAGVGLEVSGGEFTMDYHPGGWLEADAIPHNLGRQPVGLVAFADVGGTGVFSIACSSRNVGPDTFDCLAQVTDETVAATPVACCFFAFG